MEMDIPTPAVGIKGLKWRFIYYFKIGKIDSNARCGHKRIEIAKVVRWLTDTLIFQRPLWA